MRYLMMIKAADTNGPPSPELMAGVGKMMEEMIYVAALFWGGLSLRDERLRTVLGARPGGPSATVARP